MSQPVQPTDADYEQAKAEVRDLIQQGQIQILQQIALDARAELAALKRTAD